jgi:CelD/BcsL family acetyltransferase involved in cellulose biosynthesis
MVEVRTPFGGRRWVSLPFTDHCAVIGESDATGRLIAELIEEARQAGADAVELRGGDGDPGLRSAVAGVHHSLDLHDGAPRLFKRLSSMHQRNIRRAERDGVRVVRGSSAGDLQTFYELHLRTRRRQGVPIQPRRFFELLHRNVIDPGLGFVMTGYVRDRPVASAVFLKWNGVLAYKYGASDERFWQHRPNNLLLWSAIEWASLSGCRTFDFGRTDLEDTGLRAFKDGWGATERQLMHWGTRVGPRRFRPVFERTLAVAITRSHPLLCRAVGELLYRYAA